MRNSKKIERKNFLSFFTNLKQIQKKIFMKNFTTYLSTAPVVALVWFTITAALLIEINRFFPDPLVFSF
jgi:photosystem I subunit 9